jgi:hypothetical protein
MEPMDERAFAELSKRVAQAGTRRGMLRVVSAGAVTALMGIWGGAPAAAMATVGDEAFGFCSPPTTPCTQDKKCCSGKCKNGACTCRKKGAPCINRAGVVCCSQKCRNGTCK